MQRHVQREPLTDGALEVVRKAHRTAPTTSPRREPLLGGDFASSFRSAHYGPRPIADRPSARPPPAPRAPRASGRGSSPGRGRSQAEGLR
eukprot:2169884-Pyramimonas_sp.AAC.1